MTGYGTIIADPPWSYRNCGGGATRGTAASQYETSGVDSLCALGNWVRRVGADNCALLLWCTWPQLREGGYVLDAWGFDYVTGFPWVKTMPNGQPARGVGFWTMGCTEFVMVGRRGKVSVGRTGRMGLLTGELREFWGRAAQDPERNLTLFAERGRHSRKPDDLHTYAEEFLPGPYLELFARRERDGWTCLGGDLGHWLTPEGVIDAAD